MHESKWRALAGLVLILTSIPLGASAQSVRHACRNAWLSNGQWRVRVTDVRFNAATDENQQAWFVTTEWIDAGNASATPRETFLGDMTLVLEDNLALDANRTPDGTLSEQQLADHRFAPASRFRHVQAYYRSGALVFDRPRALLMTFNVDAYLKRFPGGGGKYWVHRRPPYDFAFDLTCTAR